MKYINYRAIKSYVNNCKPLGEDKMRTSRNLAETLDKRIEDLLNKACLQAQLCKRTTVLGRDLEETVSMEIMDQEVKADEIVIDMTPEGPLDTI